MNRGKIAWLSVPKTGSAIINYKIDLRLGRRSELGIAHVLWPLFSQPNAAKRKFRDIGISDAGPRWSHARGTWVRVSEVEEHQKPIEDLPQGKHF
jgi:hypothetical protein